MPRLFLLCLPVLLSPLVAQAVIVPSASATTRGTTQLNTLIRNSGAPRTYMHGINASQLAGIPVGSVINGVSFRFMVFASNSASWPAADINWNDYQIWVGPAIAPASFTGNFMTNFSSTPVQVRMGPMRLPANTYKNTNPPAPQPNVWGEFYFAFQQTYTYTGGNLGLLFSHPGSTDAATAQYLECITSDATTHGVAFTQAVFPPGTAGTATTFCVPRIHYGYGKGCPGTGNKTPMLVQTQNTSGGLGGTIRLAAANAPASVPCIYILGITRISAPLPNGCLLLTPPALTLAVLLDGFGETALPLPVPPAITVSLNMQCAIIDSGAKGGLTTTNGTEPAAK